MQTSKLFIPYDIVDNIIPYLDIKTTRNFLLSSSEIYFELNDSRHFYIVMINKIKEYFTSLSKINFEIIKLSDDDIKRLYNTFNDVYNHFKIHKNAMLSDFLIYLCEKQDTLLFEMIISHCYFSKTGDYVFNALRSDDISYLLMFYDDISIITKYIYIDIMILLHVIKFKILNKKINDVKFLLNYLLFKHFFRYSRFAEDIITQIACELIKSNNYDNLQILRMLYSKQKFYKFNLNYQQIINASMQQKYEDVIVLIHNNMSHNQTRPILISKDYIRILMKNRYYKVLEKIIELYLGDTINLKGYVDEIYYNFDSTDTECKKILRFLSDKNKIRFKTK